MKLTVNEPKLARTQKKLLRRRARSPSFAVSGTRIGTSVASPVGNVGTLLLKCKGEDEKQDELVPENSAYGCREKERVVALWTRKLGAALWQMQLPSVGSRGGGSGLGFQV